MSEQFQNSKKTEKKNGENMDITKHFVNYTRQE